MPPTLRLEEVTKRYGALVAVDEVSLRLDEPLIYGLIGPNGAGKTTLFDLITGVQAPDSGRVLLGGEDITALAPHVINRRGIGRTFQGGRLFEDMTVFENLMTACHGDFVAGRERARDLLETVELADYPETVAGNLSGGQQKLLALARTLMTDPTHLLLDEILAGVNPTLQERLLEYIRRIHENRDLTVLMIEHDINVIMRMSDHVFALTEGKLIAEGSPEEIQNDDRVLESYLGTKDEPTQVDQ